MKVLFVCALLVVAAAAMSPLKKAPRFASVTVKAATGSFTSGKYTCGTDSQDPLAKDFPVGTDARAEWKVDKWVFNGRAISNMDGSSLKDTPMTKVDICKLSPKGICKQDGTIDYCKIAGVTTCCPALKGKGTCGASGTARRYMPQVIYQKDKEFATWAATKFPGFKISSADVDLKDLKPSQDEIFWTNSISKVCPKKDAKDPKPTGVSPVPPLVCGDHYIFDGHHRWSQGIVCGFTNTCPTVGKIKVNKMNKDCKDVLNLIMKEAIDADQATPSKYVGNKWKWDAANIEFDGNFVEVESRAETLQKAAAEFVNAARGRLAAMGLELKGGDEALNELFHIYHAPNLA